MNSEDYKNRSILWYEEEFKISPLYLDMEETIEESPWHRERNVAVHTNMVVAEFISRSPDSWTIVDVVGFMAVVFHDTGKPSALEIVYREDRGNYKRFGGHEKVSARIFEDWAISNMGTMKYLGLELKHIHMIAWLCEYHLPWGIKKPAKRVSLARTALYIERECQDSLFLVGGWDSQHQRVDILERVLLSDTWGRISDDFELKRTDALAWVAEFTKFKIKMFYEHDIHEYSERIRSGDERPTLYMSIGAPGCGKTTFRRTLSDEVLIHNLDNLREEWYVDEPTGDKTIDYDLAYLRSTEDKQFSSKVHQHFMELVKTGESIYCDNTNASPKRRRFYVDQASSRGYKTIAVLFPTPLQTLIDRQKSRTDKTVPLAAVNQIWDAISQPQIGEFDEILVIE